MDRKESPLRMGAIADDLTGATDLAVTLKHEGLATVQVNGVPDAELSLPESDAVVVALKSRTVPAEEAVAQSLAALAWLSGRGAERCYFKYCSTFDSTPRGNIGPVADALIRALGCGFTVATPAYPRNGRTVYLGHLFVGDRLLSESGMRHHPLTPMTDSDLVRVLGRQTDGRVGRVPLDAVAQGADAIRRRLAQLRAEGFRYAVLDAVSDDHLVAAGEACADLPLATGGAGLAMGIARHIRQAAKAGGPPSPPGRWSRTAGPAAVLSGSCSEATLAQLRAAAGRYPSLKLDPLALAAGAGALDSALRWASAHLGALPILIHASAPPEEVAQVQERLGPGRAAVLVEAAFRALARGLAGAGVRCFVVAGGETSGAVIEALGARALVIGPEIAPGVCWTRSTGDPAFLLALKSGNFGGPEFFHEAFAALD